MDRRFIRDSKLGPLSLQKRMAETRRRTSEPAPDLTDFMNDMFFGSVDIEKKSYDLTGGTGVIVDDDDDYGFDDSTRSNSGRLTQEWLQEARRIVASSPTRCESSPTRLSGSPRFAAAAAQQQQPGSPLAQSSIDNPRDNLSRARSARRLRASEGISDEILTKSSARHSRNKSDTLLVQSFSDQDDGYGSPATAVHKWFSNILKPTNNNNNTNHYTPISDPTLSPPRPPRQPLLQRKSRFQTEPSPAPHPQGIQVPSRRTFKTPTPPDSPSRNTASLLSETLPLSPPRNLVESAHRRTISSSTCSLEKIAPRQMTKGEEEPTHEEGQHSLNEFLKEQRTLFQKISSGELHANVKIVLSAPSNSTASMVAAICHAWLLGYREREKEKEKGESEWCVVVPVMNVKRSYMWNLKQAAWLFHHASLDASALLFLDEVDMENLLVTAQLSVLVVGKDVLSNTSEVGSQCTVLTDNYCEDAYDLLQNPVLKKLLLAGILLDTQNLKASASASMTRDAEAVQLLLVGSAPNYRYALFDQLMQDTRSTSFVEALNLNYGKPSDEINGQNMEHKFPEKKSSSVSDRETIIMSSPKTFSSDTKSAKSNGVSPKPAKMISLKSRTPSPATAHAEKEAPRGKNVFFLARWFGFGPK